MGLFYALVAIFEDYIGYFLGVEITFWVYIVLAVIMYIFDENRHTKDSFSETAIFLIVAHYFYAVYDMHSDYRGWLFCIAANLVSLFPVIPLAIVYGISEKFSGKSANPPPSDSADKNPAEDAHKKN